VFISQKTAFIVVTAVKTWNLAIALVHIYIYIYIYIERERALLLLNSRNAVTPRTKDASFHR
jgi:hypothetical protein